MPTLSSAPALASVLALVVSLAVACTDDGTTDSTSDAADTEGDASETDDSGTDTTDTTDTTDATGTETTETETTETETTETETETETTESETDTTTTAGGELEALCDEGCQHFESCAPTEFEDFYGTLEACEAACVDIWSPCEVEAIPYLECFSDLACDDVVVLFTEGPGETACGPSYATAMAACE